MVDERIVERRREVRQERRRSRLHRTVLVVVALGVAVALLLVERSPLVAISDVRVVGVTHVAPAEVRRAAGIDPGTSLLRVDLAEAAEAVAALPRVEDAVIVRIDPLTLEIRVTERQPAYVARTADDAVTIDDAGIVLAAEDVDGLVAIEVDGDQLPAPGESVQEVASLANAVAVAEGLPGTLRTRVAGLQAREDDRAVLVLDDATLVEVGRADELDAKARALAAVLEDLGDVTVQVIDVRAPSAPVIVG